MITLITGQPGAGKTLYALNFVKLRAEKENRAVYYSGINDLKLPWAELVSGESWHTVPEGSIVVIDECQRVFRPRGNGATVPEHVSKLETHRHAGIDLVLITQHPMLADNNVRRLVGQHFHVVRAFGTGKATCHEWGEVKTDCDKVRTGSIRHDFFYPKESFGWYKSAELHTHKARIPMRVYFLVLVPLLIGALIWWVFVGLQKRVSPAVPLPAAVPLSAVGSSAPGKVVTPYQYVQAREARIVGLAYTAPVYDEIVRPTEAPFPVACISSSTRCECFSQQGTPLAMPLLTCASIVKAGIFKDFQEKQTKEREQRPIDREASKHPPELPADIDRPKKYLVIDPPPPLRVSPGFGAHDPSKDKQAPTPPPGGSGGPSVSPRP